MASAELSDANLTGADLDDAILFSDGILISHAILTGITWDLTTVWPEGFTPPRSAEQPS